MERRRAKKIRCKCMFFFKRGALPQKKNGDRQTMLKVIQHGVTIAIFWSGKPAGLEICYADYLLVVPQTAKILNQVWSTESNNSPEKVQSWKPLTLSRLGRRLVGVLLLAIHTSPNNGPINMIPSAKPLYYVLSIHFACSSMSIGPLVAKLQ